MTFGLNKRNFLFLKKKFLLSFDTSSPCFKNRKSSLSKGFTIMLGFYWGSFIDQNTKYFDPISSEELHRNLLSIAHQYYFYKNLSIKFSKCF